MNIIKYTKFYDSKSLEISILEMMNKLLSYSENYQQVVFTLLMDNISKKIDTKRLSYNFDIKTGYWSQRYGPCSY